MDCELYRRLYQSRQETESADDGEAGVRSAYLRRIIRQHFPQDRDAVILDLGCGSGLLLALAAGLGYRRASGVDASPSRIATAQRRGATQTTCGNLCEHLAALPPNSHDLIIAFDVLEHFGGDALVALVDAVNAALRPGGRWLIHVPNAASPFFGQIFYGDLTHRTGFTAESLRWLLVNSGFRDVRCWEDTPAIHGVKSFIRRVGWSVLRTVLRAWTAIETGDPGRDAVLTRCLVGVATK
jgi:2-polyprenyl-3-methyl-5-hydroxy-6-metoxy-1,4-benzoquinol methylase